MRDDRELRETIGDHVRATTEPGYEPLILVDELLRHCWPGGQADHSVPAAYGWLGAWGPVKVIDVAVECTCASTGHCSICN